MSDVLRTAVCEEIEALHRFFVQWFTGSIANTERLFEAEFLDRFDEQLVLIPPSGSVLGLSALADGIRARHASNPEFRIAIRNVAVRETWDNLVLATYEEWQRNALASTPPDNGRVASVLFRRDRRLRWLHVHETWLPESVMRTALYDF